MDRFIVLKAFHTFVFQGEGKPEAKREFKPGQVLEHDDIPEGHSAEAWEEKGLIKAA